MSSRSRSVKLVVCLLLLLSAVWLYAQAPAAPTGVLVNAGLTPPTLTSLSVNTGPVGTTVILTGTTFSTVQGTSTVTFNGTAATATAWSNTSITVTVPAGATTGLVRVTVAGNQTAGITFTVTTSGSTACGNGATLPLCDATNTGLAGAGISEASLVTTGVQSTYGTAFNGQTISGKKFTSGILVTGQNITFSGNLFELPAGAGSTSLECGVGCSNLLVLNNTFRTSGSATSGIFEPLKNRDGGSWTIRGNDASHGENIITTFNDNALIEGNYLHAPFSNNPAGHNDTIEVYGGTGIIIRNNTILMDHTVQNQSPTAPINVAPWTGSGSQANVTNFDLLDNYIDGDWFLPVLLDTQQAGAHTLTNIRILRNRFGGHNGPGAYGTGFGGSVQAIENIGGAMTRKTTDTAGADQYYTPTSGPDANIWFYCTNNPFTIIAGWSPGNLSPDRSGQVIF